MDMNELGFVKVGCSVPEIKPADVMFNLEKIKEQIDLAVEKNIGIVNFPELTLTGYTCGDLFYQDALIDMCNNALDELKNYLVDKNIVVIIGVPVRAENGLYNAGVVINKGKILGVVPKKYITNNDEVRWFKNGNDIIVNEIDLLGEKVLFGNDLIFEATNMNDLKLGIEFNDDLFNINPKSNEDIVNGATIIFNLSNQNELVGKYEVTKQMVGIQSMRGVCGYVYTSCGVNESTTDTLFAGTSMIYENGKKLVENNRFDYNSNLIYSDIDVKRIVNLRRKNNNYVGSRNDGEFRKVSFLVNENKDIDRVYSKTPFVPVNDLERDERCLEIINIQSCGLATRLKHTGIKKCVMGISGGLDSTLAFLVIVEAYKKLGRDLRDIVAVTMPGFGTTGRTYNNAVELVKRYGATLREVDIKNACMVHYDDIGHDINNHDITYENSQARERTQILMDIANQENGLVVGTGDLSELALGWCTYNGDHMSMYGVNGDIPKTLVRYLVRYLADHDDVAKDILYDVLDTPVSPELLPPDEKGNILQVTEDKVGPYILHDFYLYHFIRYGASPVKIFELAKRTFKDQFTEEEILTWLEVFIRRFINQQFKRSCMPDGVKVGTVSLSPRGDLKMPSDASSKVWLNELEKVRVKKKV